MRRLRTLALAGLPALALGLVSPAWGAVQSTESIRSAAKRFLDAELRQEGHTIEVEVGYVDRRLRMPRCSAALEAFIPPGGRRKGRITAGVRCPGERPWKLFVDARVRLYDEIVVARRSLARGEVLDGADLRIERRDVSRLQPGYYGKVGELTGKHLTRGISPGTVLTHRLVKLPASVKRGQRVILVARTSGLEVRMDGKALSDASIGDVVKVRNRRSERIVEGVVLGNGIVDVPL